MLNAYSRWSEWDNTDTQNVQSYEIRKQICIYERKPGKCILKSSKLDIGGIRSLLFVDLEFTEGGEFIRYRYLFVEFVCLLPV